MTTHDAFAFRWNEWPTIALVVTPVLNDPASVVRAVEWDATGGSKVCLKARRPAHPGDVSLRKLPGPGVDHGETIAQRAGSVVNDRGAARPARGRSYGDITADGAARCAPTACALAASCDTERLDGPHASTNVRNGRMRRTERVMWSPEWEFRITPFDIARAQCVATAYHLCRA